MDPIPDDTAVRVGTASVFSDDPDAARAGRIPPAFAVTGVLVAAPSSQAPRPDSRQLGGAVPVDADSAGAEALASTPTTPWTVDGPLFTPETQRQSSLVDDLPLSEAQVDADGEEVFVLYRTKLDPYELGSAGFEPSAASGERSAVT